MINARRDSEYLQWSYGGRGKEEERKTARETLLIVKDSKGDRRNTVRCEQISFDIVIRRPRDLCWQLIHSSCHLTFSNFQTMNTTVYLLVQLLTSARDSETTPATDPLNSSSLTKQILTT